MPPTRSGPYPGSRASSTAWHQVSSPHLVVQCKRSRRARGRDPVTSLAARKTARQPVGTVPLLLLDIRYDIEVA